MCQIGMQSHVCFSFIVQIKQQNVLEVTDTPSSNNLSNAWLAIGYKIYLFLHPLPTVGGQHTLQGLGEGRRECLAKRYIRTCKDDRVEDREQEIKRNGGKGGHA